MRALAAVLVITLAPLAHADSAEPKLTAGASAVIWLPSGDADEFSNESLGIRPFITYRALPYLAIVGTFDYIFVNEKTGVDSITYYTVSAGARLIKSRPGQIEPYGELLLGWHHLSSNNLDDSNIGFRIGGGATYPLSGNLLLQGGLSYSAVSIDAGIVNDIDVDALALEIGLGGRF